MSKTELRPDRIKVNLKDNSDTFNPFRDQHKCGVVIDAGSDCKDVKVGELIYFDKLTDHGEFGFVKIDDVLAVE